MTEIQKKKVNWWLELIPKGITPVLLIAIIWKGGVFYEAINNSISEKGFDSALQKQQFKDHVENSQPELRLYLSRVQTDSVLGVLKTELQNREDVRELAEKNSIQIFQIKQFQKQTNLKLDQIIKKQ